MSEMIYKNLFVNANEEWGLLSGPCAMKVCPTTTVCKSSSNYVKSTLFFHSQEINNIEENARLDQLLTKYPDNKDYLFKRGFNYLEAKEFERAAIDFRRLAKINPGDVASMLGLAKALACLNQVTEAYKLYDKLLINNPNNSMVFVERGRLFFSQQNYSAAIGDFNSALEIEPDDIIAEKWKEKAVENSEYSLSNPCK